MRPHVPPQVGVVLDRPAPHHLLDPVGVDLPGPVVGRDADPREGPEDRRARRHHPGPLPAPEGRVRRQGEQQRQVAPDPVGDVDRPVGALDRHVDVGAEDQLLVGDVGELARRAPGSGGDRRSPGPPRARTGGCPRPPAGAPAARRSAATSRRSLVSSAAASATLWHGLVAISSTDCISSGFTWPSSSARHRVEDRLDLLREAQAVGVEDHQLLLDADRERGPVEAVFEHERARVLWAPWRSGPRPSRSPFWRRSRPASAPACAACCSSSAPATARCCSCPSTRASSTARATSSPTRPRRTPSTSSASPPRRATRRSPARSASRPSTTRTSPARCR